jgi:SAM-dependent methyltransferase
MKPATGASTPCLPAPSVWVSEWAGLIENADASPSVLDVACGSGRHMAHLSQLGMLCTGIDRDEAALLTAQAFGTIVCADIQQGPWPIPGRQFDAVLVTHYLWRPLLPTILDSVRPGGVLIYETFSQAHAKLGRPSRPEFLLQHGELLTICQAAQMQILAYQDLILQNPKRAMQRIVARKTIASSPPAPVA